MKELVHYIQTEIQQIRWPTNTAITPQSLEQYQAAWEILNSYRGHPDVLLEALDAFAATGSMPLAYGGISGVMRTAAFLSGDDFDRDGLNAAVAWLDKATKLAPDSVDLKGQWA